MRFYALNGDILMSTLKKKKKKSGLESFGLHDAGV